MDGADAEAAPPSTDRGWVVLGAAGLLLAPLARLEALAPAHGDTGQLVFSLVLALFAHEGAGAPAALGRLGAAVGPHLSLVASGLSLTAIFGARAARARSGRELGLHLSLAFVGGVAAGRVARASDGEASLWAAGLALSALLASAPWLLPAEPRRARGDDPRTGSPSRP